MIPDSIIEIVGPIVESCANDLARRYYTFGGDREDLAQEAWLWIYSHPRKVIEWFDPDLHDPRSAEKLLAFTLRNELRAYGEEVKAQHLGYSLDDLVWYSKQGLKELLPAMFDDEAWLNPEQGDGERRSPADPATGGNWIATLADVSQAYAKLEKWDRELLARFHRDGLSNNEMAEACNVSKQTMSDWHDKSLRKLVDALGGPKPRRQHDEDCDHGWRGRKAMSNAQANAFQSSYYEES